MLLYFKFAVRYIVMKLIKNLFVVLFIIYTKPVLFAQDICIEETILFEDGVNFFAIPNAFTPNNDGINDILLLFNTPLKQKRIIVTNPADSTELFKSDDLNLAWDGLDNEGEVVPEGIYSLTVNFKFENDAVEIACRNIYLIRENCLDFNEDSLNFPIDFNEETLQFNTNTVVLPDCINSTSSTHEIAMRLFPNPASEKIFIDSPLWINEAYIFNSTGQLIYKQKNVQDQTIDISSLPSGIYTIQLKNQQTSSSKKIIVQ